MRTQLLLAAAQTAPPGPSYQLNLGRYFPSAAVEQAERTRLMQDQDEFLKQPAASLDSPQALSRWLAHYDTLSKDMNRHDTYVYLRAEEDSDDRTDAAADEALSVASDKLDAAVQNTLAEVGASRLHGFLNADPVLQPYAYFIDSSLLKTAHTRPGEQAKALLTTPALDSLGAAYTALRRNALASVPAAKMPGGKDAFDAKWKPYLDNEDAFAAVLVPIVSLHNGQARLQGFADGPEEKYFRLNLTSTEVGRMVAAVRKSDANARYIAVITAAAAQRLHLAPDAVHAWDLDAADSYQPAPVAFPDVVPMILAAEQPMGPEYAGQFTRLFDPANERVGWCHTDRCDDTGFSVEVPGIPSGLYYGAYKGDTNSMRATAHEAGHAVHGQFKDENQPLAVYGYGPNYMGESFAIFNEYLFLEHLYQTAPTPEARAYYLDKFLAQLSFEVWGSAEETDLEQAIYIGVQDGSLRTAADLDALTLKTLARYTPAPALDPAMKVYWARDRLFFTDPLYDVNYLYAGLLALRYLNAFEQDPKGFPARYVALLKNGFTDTPQVLEKKFLGVDMDDADGLVRNASEMLTTRTAQLQALYAGCGKSPCPRP